MVNPKWTAWGWGDGPDNIRKSLHMWEDLNSSHLHKTLRCNSPHLCWGGQRSILQVCWPVSITEWTRLRFSETPYHKNKEGGEWPRKTHATNLWSPCTCACTHRYAIKHKHSRIMHHAWDFRSVRNRIYNTKRTYFRPEILRVQDQPQSRILLPIFLKAFLRKMHKNLPL